MPSMQKISFSVRDANEHNIELLRNVVKASKDPNVHWSQSIILEDFGSTLTQHAWTDETGYFVTYRLHPIDRHLQYAKDLAKKFENEFAKLFPGKLLIRSIEGEGDAERVTLSVVCNTHSIGDLKRKTLCNVCNGVI